MIDPNFDAIIFNCDGTLVDSETITLQVLVDYVQELGLTLDADEAMGLFVGRDMPTVVGVLEPRLDREMPADFVQEFRDRQAVELRRSLKAIDGAHELLAAISKPFSVASNAPHDKIEINLTTTGLARYFTPETTLSAYDIDVWKPEPDLFLHVAEKMQVAPERCVVIEDSLAGVQAGVAAGMQVIGFSQISDQRPSDEVPCVYSLLDLVEILR